MKKVMGGVLQVCCLHSADWTQLDCANMDLQSIQDIFYGGANQQYSNYCCSSCASSYQSATGTPFPGATS